MHPSRLRLGPSQSRPLTDASPGLARSPGLRVCRAAPSRRRNIHTHAPFRTECQSFLRCRDMRLTISPNQRSAHAVALRRQRSGVRIPSGAPETAKSLGNMKTSTVLMPWSPPSYKQVVQKVHGADDLPPQRPSWNLLLSESHSSRLAGLYAVALARQGELQAIPRNKEAIRRKDRGFKGAERVHGRIPNPSGFKRRF